LGDVQAKPSFIVGVILLLLFIIISLWVNNKIKKPTQTIKIEIKQKRFNNKGVEDNEKTMVA